MQMRQLDSVFPFLFGW